MAKKTTQIQQTPEGERLEAVIIKYFVKQKKLADKIGIVPDTLSKYITGRMAITKAFAQQLQGKAGINADYILNGNEPMMLEEALATMPRPRFDAPVPLRMGKKTLHGITKQYSIDGDDVRAELKDEGEANVASILLGDTDPQPVIYKLSNLAYRMRYIDRYKKEVRFIVDERMEVKNGNTVIIAKGEHFYLCKMVDGKAIHEACGDEIDMDGVVIKGVVLRAIVDM
ncbi:MAG: helix-turn-helix domain-containing protein [Ignavibacteria bacterium]|jgi:plasmid maintenance system antidote protein VapI|nr:helix-turn-helix domain-containing protein [Ignavibacteria bacterium]